jgi:Family of unknown function (DUF5652)
MWLIPVIIWDAVWKGIGLWKSAGNKQIIWFIFIFIVNSVGILPIIYILFFQRRRQSSRRRRR